MDKKITATISYQDRESEISLRAECMNLQATLVLLRNQNKAIQQSISKSKAEKLASDLSHLKQEFYLTELQKNLDRML